jgi:hypothetical protein
MENDYIVRPVENLQNVSGITPAKHREEKKRQQASYGQNEENPEQPQDSVEDKNDDGKLSGKKDDQTTIDYRA